MIRIPRVFHQVWVGDEPFPDEFRALQETWTANNAGWELKLWTEENLPDGLSRAEAYDRMRQPAERADILRLDLLDRFGGVYVDVDFECLRPIEPLLDDVTCFVGRLDSGRVSNTIVGAVPAHPFVRRALREVRPRTTYGPVDRAGTGPLLLDRLLPEFPEVTVFEPEVFYATTPETAVYAYHLMARTWKDAAQLRDDLARAERARAHAQDELARVRRRYALALEEIEALRAGRPLAAAGRRLRRLAVRRIPGRVRRLLGRA